MKLVRLMTKSSMQMMFKFVQKLMVITCFQSLMILAAFTATQATLKFHQQETQATALSKKTTESLKLQKPRIGKSSHEGKSSHQRAKQVAVMIQIKICCQIYTQQSDQKIMIALITDLKQDKKKTKVLTTTAQLLCPRIRIHKQKLRHSNFKKVGADVRGKT